MALDARRLLVLSAIASAGSVTAAGRSLHLSASAVSQQLATLEREAGVALVDRTHLGVVLTPAGHALARRADQVKDALTAAENDLADLTGRIAGIVNVATYASIARRVVAPAVGDLATTHPEITVRMSIESEHAVLLRRLSAGSADVIVVEEYLPEHADEHRPDFVADGLISQPILDDPYWVITPTSWPAPASAADVLTRPWISGPPRSLVRGALESLASAAGVAAAVQHECCEFPGVLDMVAAGLGSAIVPQLALTAVPAEVTITGFRAGLRRLHTLRLGRPTRDRAVVLAVLASLTRSGRKAIDAA